jgi:hypothetical protein
MSYAQGPVQPRLNATVGALPYINTTANGTTCALGAYEISMSAPYAIFGLTADSFCKLYATNYFGTQALQAKNTISGFYPDFYIASPTEVRSTWTSFNNITLSGSSDVKYEVIYVFYTSVTANLDIDGQPVETNVVTDAQLKIEIKSGGDIVAGVGYYRKLGNIIT